MGWFWAEPSPQRTAAILPPHPVASSNAVPPPECPMHKAGASPSNLPPRQDTATRTKSSCPVKAPNRRSWADRWSKPVANKTTTSLPQSESRSSPLSSLNPLNYMFSSISNERSSEQSTSLPLERETSSIPRGDGNALWEYPSPQQMYNAMLRKGYTDTPVDAVESMVAVHNFLNEGAWQEIVGWEDIFSRGLAEGWEKCKRGEENIALERAMAEARAESFEDGPRLTRFMGRPGDLTPKARMLQVMGWLYPSRFGTEPPFDRHDWYVTRGTARSQKEIRYVIDYYSGAPEPTGEPVFYLDIRPAIDTPTAAVERMMRWGGDVWFRASGITAREASKAAKAAEKGKS